MKIISNKLLLAFCAIFMLASCGEEDFVTYEGEESGDRIIQQVNDAYLQINTPVVSFQAGTESYEVSMYVVNGTKEVNSINIYSTFTDANLGGAEEVLLTTCDVPDGNRVLLTKSLTYNDLQSGITVGGQPLPASDLDLAIGSGWKLRFEGVSDEGTVPLGGSVNIAVLSRFAGLYRVLESDYYRINVQSGIADWSGQERFIGSVDETTFSYNDFWGPFAWGGSNFTFSIDPATNEVTVPLLTGDGQLANGGGLFSGNRGVGCHTEPGIFVDVPCAGSNMLIVDDAEGRHRLILTYGYFTDGSGSRQFYEVLEKIVD